MTTTRRRRWLLAIAAVVVVAGVLGFVVLREDPKNGVPRLVVLRQEQVDGQKVVVFRFDAPKHMGAMLKRVTTQNASTATEHDVPVQMKGTLSRFVGAGQSREFSFIPPPHDVWRLRCEILWTDTRRMRDLPARAQMCWRMKSLRPLLARGGVVARGFGILESDLITNAIPATTETLAR